MFLFSGRAGADGIPGKDGRDGTPGCTTNLKLFSKLNTKIKEYFAEIKSIEITLNESTTFPTEIFLNCLHLVQFYFALETVQHIALCIGLFFCCCCRICKIVYMFKLIFRCKWKKWCRWKRW